MKKGKIAFRIAVCAVLVFGGVAGMLAMAEMEEPPAEAKIGERPLRVETVSVEPEDVVAVITGYGKARSLNVVSIASELAGRVVAVHPRLEPGEIVKKGETLFRIDSKNYKAVRDGAAAIAKRLGNAVQRLEKAYEIDLGRMKTLERNRELAKAEFQRRRTLLYDRKIGSQSELDATERDYNDAREIAGQMVRSIAIYPIRIREAKQELASARANLDAAEAELGKCEVNAPFDGRVANVDLEAGEYVSPGQNLVTLADDSILEIHVPLDSEEAGRWLPFKKASGKNGAWFPELEPATCGIRRSKNEADAREGKLHRVVKFDEDTRTTRVAVRIDADAMDDDRPPLVAGMFCEVSIPGKTMRGVMRVPAEAVSFENTVFVDCGGRLKTVNVKVDRIQNGFALVCEGLAAGDRVVATRLVNPLENALLATINKE